MIYRLLKQRDITSHGKRAGCRFFIELSSYRLSPLLLLIITITTLLVVLVVPLSTVEAQTQAGYSEYYIPGGTQQLWDIYVNLDNNPILDSSQGMHAVIAVTATLDDTKIYYDHWEDTYDFDPNNPIITADETYTLNQGVVQEFESSNIPIPRGMATFYDGRDRIYVAGGPVTVTRASWPESIGTVFSLAWEIYPTKPFLTNYTIPVGQDLANPPYNYDDFDRVYVIVQSTTNGNNVRIDDPLTGPSPDVDVVLNQGELTQLYSINHGTTVAADDPVQVQFMVGQAQSGGASEVRGFSAVPDSLWDTEYFNPVGSSNEGNTDLYLYNPNASTITINFEDTAGSGSFAINSGNTIAYSDPAAAGRLVPQGSGVYVSSSNVFWGIGSGDTESPTYDWGFSLVPVWALEDHYFLGWAPGTSQAIPTFNGSPMYITPVQDDTTIYCDYSPTDGAPDVTYTLNRLQSQKVFDPDNENTGMHIWATGIIAVVWGEDPDPADVGTPYLDLGYSTLPLPEDWMDVVLGIEKTANPTSLPPGPGQISTFTLVVSTSSFPVNAVDVIDTLPPGWNYVPSSTTITLPDTTVISGPAADPIVSLPDLTWDLDQGMGINETLTIVFDGVTTLAVSSGHNQNDAQASGTRLGGAQVFTPIDSAFVYISALTIDKDTSTPTVELGGVATYTISIVNGTAGIVTNVTVADDLPPDFSYDSGSIAEVNATRTGVTDPSFGDTSLAWGTWDIDPNGSVTITFDVNVDAGATLGTYDNTASADSTQTGVIDDDGLLAQDPDTPPDEDPEDDEDVAIADIPSSIVVTKTAVPTSLPEPGGNVDFTVRIDNTSAVDTVTIDSLIDDIHGHLNGQGTCSVPQVIAVGGFYECTFTASVTGIGGDTETDTATASGMDDDGVPVSDDDDAMVTIVDISKSLVDTNHTFTTTPDVAIGEILTYEISVNVRSGTMASMTLTDVLDRGLVFVTCESITPSPPTLTTTRGDFTTVCNTPTVSIEPSGSPNPADQGRRVEFDFGDVGNPTASAGTLSVRYTVVVLNNIENQRGGSLNNNVDWQWIGGSLSSSASPVTIVEPELGLAKNASPSVALPGSTITFTLNLNHDVASDTDAFDLSLQDVVPTGLTYVPGSLAWTGVGLAPTVLDDSTAPTLSITWDSFPLGQSSEIQYQATLGSLPPGSSVTNTAFLQWTSLPGDVSSAQSPWNSISTERKYDPGDPVNLYGLSASSSIQIPRLPDTGFAPRRVTPLTPPQAAPTYQRMGGMWLDIPTLDVLVPIVGVPMGEREWDLTWLWNRAGYLEGTAFPTRPGNTALTAHVYLPSGEPGPFAGLANLHWGDIVVLNAYGQRYVYEVRQVRYVLPRDLSVLRHEAYDWLTLITCAGYDQLNDRYLSRVVVRAVLVEIR